MVIKEFEIDLRGISGYIEGEEDEKIHSNLRKRGLLRDNLLYSVFNARRIKQVKERGNYRKDDPDSIFALTKEELIWQDENPANKNTLSKLTMGYEKPAIAIYNRNMFSENPEVCSPFEYCFKDPTKKCEALLGIARLRII